MGKLILLFLLCFVLSSCSMLIAGDNGAKVSGNSTGITIGLDGSVLRGVATDSGNATPVNNILGFHGTGTVSTSASGYIITITGSGSSGSGNLTLTEGHIFVGNSSGLAEDMQVIGDASLNSLGELTVYWADQCNTADTATSATTAGNATYALDSDKLDGQHGSYYLSTTGTAADSTLFAGYSAVQWSTLIDIYAMGDIASMSFKSNSGTAHPTSDGNISFVGGAGISTSGSGSTLTVANSGVTSVAAGTGIQVSGGTGAVTITNSLPDTQLSSKYKEYTRDMSVASGDVAYTGVGFKPTSLIIFASSGSAASNGFADSGKLCGGQYLYSGSWTGQTSYCIYDKVGSGNYVTALVKSYDNDGFTLTWTKNGTITGTCTFDVICYK